MSETSKRGKTGSRGRPAPEPVPASLAVEFLTTALAELTRSGVTVRTGNHSGSAVVMLIGWRVEIVDGAAVFTVTPETPQDGRHSIPAPNIAGPQ